MICLRLGFDSRMLQVSISNAVAQTQSGKFFFIFSVDFCSALVCRAVCPAFIFYFLRRQRRISVVDKSGGKKHLLSSLMCRPARKPGSAILKRGPSRISNDMTWLNEELGIVLYIDNQRQLCLKSLCGSSCQTIAGINGLNA